MAVQEASVSVENSKKGAEEIPSYLIYEIIDGQPVYYRGYKEVLSKNKKSTDIMGYGGLQWYLLSIIGFYLEKNLEKKYFPFIGEGGLHLENKNNLSLDLAIYFKKEISLKKLKNSYLSNPPLVVVEVDTKADSDYLALGNYYNKKTKKLLDFGVEKVVWIFTETEQVMIAEKNKPWLTIKWKDQIEILGQNFSIQQVIDEAENEV